MIKLLDQFNVAAENLPKLLALIEQEYREGASSRGMSQSAMWVSPPLALTRALISLWVLWEVADVGAWWNMRFRAGSDPKVSQFWAAADMLCECRARHTLVDGKPDQPLPAAQNIDRFRTTTVLGARETTQYFLREQAIPEQIADWESALQSLPGHIQGLSSVLIKPNLEGSFCAGNFTFDAQFENSAALHEARQSDYWRNVVSPLHKSIVEREERVELQLVSGGLRQARIENPIKRTAYFRVIAGVDEGAVEAWVADLLDMPAYMPGIVNWALSRSAADDSLYVWEQEYRALEDLQGEYMVHPHHWAHVDSWFDPEFSKRIVDTHIVHAFCQADTSMLADSIE